VDEVGSDWVGIYLDTANMMEYGFPEHWVRALGSRIKRVHLKDYSRSRRRFVNLLEGDTDWPVVMSELSRAGYRAPLIHEIAGTREELVDIGDRMRRIASMS
jgi:hexulose-6-phosphate isomerase